MKTSTITVPRRPETLLIPRRRYPAGRVGTVAVALPTGRIAVPVITITTVPAGAYQPHPIDRKTPPISPARPTRSTA
ncbi:hypothetical protein SAMN05216251_12756 [Actinacidiphila alni]|uniref:Uncharacterized protein n=1 Tax=Actinacidiphila alni TaxID=380248 RepID=A0A1I2L9U2_9ACTN|nr:hypothetical protein [Actinacidiphila alni]SFF75240.1 hypothetical protein SAMN05216251_12756 [Actinacidiphila alni]